MPKSFIDHRLFAWTDDLEPNVIEQALRVAELPFIHKHVALMPDAHLGYGATVGSVIPTRGAIIPAAVGVDIGCGMVATETDLHANDLPDDLTGLLHAIEQSVPAGVGRGHEDHKTHTKLHHLGAWKAPIEDKAFGVARQMGTLGSGNHFIEVCVADDGDETIWIVLHSGSRGIGNRLAQYHINEAKGLMQQYFVDLSDPDLAYFVQGTPEFEAYIHDLRWAQEYARLNRETMMDAVLDDVTEYLGLPFQVMQRINCHHNYTEQEHHFGENVWVTRKGAIRAREGDLGVIPGSMGTNSFIVKGLGNPDSFMSSSHGAGRKMSRTRAKKELSLDTLGELMAGKAWLDTKAEMLLDEHPGAYKDIHKVMRDQADLVKVVVELHQILNYKGA
jgi:tRNA-splicing ligase RtcB